MKKKAVKSLTGDQVISAIAEGVIVNAYEAKKHTHDAFEAYTYNLQLKVFSTGPTFKERCLLGYHALLQELNA
jgi:hypothetical protein